MSTIVTIIAVVTFLAIVYRKRLLPLINKAGKAEADKGNATSAAPTALPERETENVYIKVVGVNVAEYLNVDTLSEAIDTKIQKELDVIYRTYMGSYIGIDVFMQEDLLLFLIRWKT